MTKFMKRLIGLLLLACVLTASAHAGVVFSEDFSGSLDTNWNADVGSDGTVAIVSEVLELDPNAGHARVISKDTFTTPGVYRLDFDMLHTYQNLDSNRLRIYMPGGFIAMIRALDNGFNAVTGHTVAGETLEGGTWTSNDTYDQWRSYSIVQDGRTTEFYKESVLQKSWTLSADPNFAANPTIRLLALSDDGSSAYAHFDNMTLTRISDPPVFESVDLSSNFNADTIGVADGDAGGTGYYDPAEDFKFIDFGPVAGYTLGPVGANGADSPNTVLLDLGGSNDPELGNQAPVSATIDVDDAKWSDFSVLHSGFRDNLAADAVITITYTDATTQEFTNWQIVSDGGISWGGTAGDATTATMSASTYRYRVSPATGLIGNSFISEQTFLGLDGDKLVDTITFDITGLDPDDIAQVGVYAVSYTPAEPQTYVPGDANRNGVVDAADAAILALNWQSTTATWTMGDFNEDNVVNDLDATLLATNWHFGLSAAASIPEPSTLTLLAFGCFVLLVRKTRHCVLRVRT